MIFDIFGKLLNGKVNNQVAPARQNVHGSPSVRRDKKGRIEISPGSKRVKKKKPASRINKDFIQAVARAKGFEPGGNEAGIRSRLLDSFLSMSHGDLASFSRLHLEALEKDPIFYGHLARWYFEKGSVRDHHELFIAHLLTSPFPEHRENGTVLIQFLRPYQAARVVKYCKETLHFSTRALRTAVKLYLKRREDNPLWFDEHVIRRKDSFKYLYSTLHIKPGERAERVLFKNDPPKDSRVYATRLLGAFRNDPAIQAEMILKHKIIFTTALGYIKHFTPAVIYSLVSTMTPQQAINNLKFLEKRGALQDPDTRKILEEKLAHGIKESRVSDFKAGVALSRINADKDLAEKLLNITGERLKNRGRITDPTAIFVDKSGSMQSCIEIGKMLATLCSTIADSDLYVYAFDSYAFSLRADKGDFAAWEKAFAPIRADGCTSIGAPFKLLLREKTKARQILVISDGEENTSPMFRQSLEDYERKTGEKSRVILLKVCATGATTLERNMNGKEMTVIPFNGDYYSLPNIVPMLCAGSNFDLVGEIMDTPLYNREGLLNLPPGFDEATYEVL